MNAHLTEDQFSWWLAGEREAAVGRHLEACAECRAGLAAFEQTISQFRDAVQSAPVPAARMAGESARTRPLRWALAAVAAAVLIAVPVYRVSEERERREQAARAAEVAASDALLLNQVDAEISRAVPATMEPLLKLVAWDSGDGKLIEENK
jgi:predicted anti-sigma-YlaC factor YlaD